MMNKKWGFFFPFHVFIFVSVHEVVKLVGFFF